MRNRFYLRGIRISGREIHYNPDVRPSIRSVVTSFTDSSRKRLSWVYMQGNWKSMITLTYHNNFPSDFKQCKKQLNSVLQTLRRHNIKFLWCVEWQRRGFPHFHIWMDRKFSDVDLEMDTIKETSWRFIMESWLRVTGQDNDKDACNFGLNRLSYTHWTVTIKSNYPQKYAEKNEQKILPVGIKQFGRWWGCSRDLDLEQDDFRLTKDKQSIDRISSFMMYRRMAKKYIERKFKMKFSRDKVGSMMPVRWMCSEEHVNSLKRLFDYYLYYLYKKE